MKEQVLLAVSKNDEKSGAPSVYREDQVRITNAQELRLRGGIAPWYTTSKDLVLPVFTGSTER